MLRVGGRLGVWKGVLWVFISERRFAGVFGWIILGLMSGCELEPSDGVFLGNSELTPAE